MENQYPDYGKMDETNQILMHNNSLKSISPENSPHQDQELQYTYFQEL